MASCTACAALLREGARFCTGCGAPVAAVAVEGGSPVERPVDSPVEPAVEPLTDRAREVPARVPATGRIVIQAERSTAATVALLTGLAPLVISVVGNLVAAQLGVVAVERAEAGADGAWAPVLLTLALVFVLNAGSLTVCAILGTRGLRETANGVTRGRGFAVAGLALGGVNLVLWVAGLAVSIGGLSAVLA